MRQPSPPLLKVALVDESSEVQGAMDSLLGQIEGVRVVGAAADTEAALHLIADTRPDVVVIDVALHGHDRGIDVLRHVAAHQPGTDVIVLSNHNRESLREAMLQAGARAFFDKSLQFREACEWIRTRAARR